MTARESRRGGRLQIQHLSRALEEVVGFLGTSADGREPDLAVLGERAQKVKHDAAFGPRPVMQMVHGGDVEQVLRKEAAIGGGSERVGRDVVAMLAAPRDVQAEARVVIAVLACSPVGGGS